MNEISLQLKDNHLSDKVVLARRKIPQVEAKLKEGEMMMETNYSNRQSVLRPGILDDADKDRVVRTMYVFDGGNDGYCQPSQICYRDDSGFHNATNGPHTYVNV